MPLFRSSDQAPGTQRRRSLNIQRPNQLGFGETAAAEGPAMNRPANGPKVVGTYAQQMQAAKELAPDLLPGDRNADGSAKPFAMEPGDDLLYLQLARRSGWVADLPRPPAAQVTPKTPTTGAQGDGQAQLRPPAAPR